MIAGRENFVTQTGFSPPVTILLIDNHPERRKRKGIAREFIQLSSVSLRQDGENRSGITLGCLRSQRLRSGLKVLLKPRKANATA